MADPALAALQDTVRSAADARRPLTIRGGGTKTFYGEAEQGDIVNTTSLAGIVAYEPTELVVTARSGTPLADVEAAMAAQGQMLGFEPPYFASGGTLGGAIATGLSGPRRPYAGAARDFVLGVRVVDGTGEELHFGGRVMKNVAGFDVSRLMTGSLGTLGVITEVSLKCLPVPKAEATRVVECSADESIRLANRWGGRPLPISATCWHDGRLWVRLSGAPPAVAAATPSIGGDRYGDGAAFWRSVRDHTHSFFVAAGNDDIALWRLSVKASAAANIPGGFAQMIEWSGSLRWLAAAANADPAPIRAWAAAQGGHATQFRGRADAGVFAPRDATTLQLHQRLKAQFDPHRIFNRGRLFAEL
jgi:glycolate oxidase FAD binding subunit